MEDLFVKNKSLEEEIYELNIENNQTRGSLIQIHIADIHFGAMDPKIQFDILREQFINRLIDIDFDILSINGDLYDHKFMSNSDVIMYSVMFINLLVDLCKMKNATLVIIHGTLYHDANQLKLFYHLLEDPTIDIRIVETVKFEYIKGAKILCIPELHNLTRQDYEKFLFYSGTYDSVFMHGTIEGAIYGAKQQESAVHSEKAPVFTIDDFRMCRGPIYSGHVHTPGCFYGYFYYCGSPLRWKFGEETTKGFLIGLQNLDTDEHLVHLEEIKSFRYDTINLDHLLSSDPKCIIDYVDNLQKQGVDYIRIKFTDVYTEEQMANIDILKKYYKNITRVKIQSQNNKIKQIIKENNELDDKYKEYQFLFDKSLSEYEIFTMYVNQRKGYDYITVDELKELLKEM